ncbi:phosphonate ABC transporter ATP-binding protein [Oceanobacillus damuensis]|uniref:phosphonate ABC transporter ATP-binding protein n=1 Tax=Oceanobacillus damuensis TaxID=937928 RepID=UPI000829F142|nr:phosphonate ABC transporter ATP-binding protein [Oceanobacillus damuensis]
MINITKLAKSFGNNEVLKEISFNVEQGEFLIVLGSSGAGKSTLLRCINGLVTPTSGEVLINDMSVGKNNIRKIRKKVGMIFQGFNVIDNLSVLNNVLIGRLAYKSPLNILFSKEERRLAEEAIEMVGLNDKKNVRVDRLSGGQKQRVGIARVLVQNPEIILADEPVSSLDPVIGKEILELLREINQQRGTTIICNLHQLDYAKTFGKRIIGVRNGIIQYNGTPSNIKDNDLVNIYGEKFLNNIKSNKNEIKELQTI